MNVLRGVFKYNVIKNEPVLRIELSNDGHRTFSELLPIIISDYKNHVSVIQICGTEGDLNEVISILRQIRASGLKTAFETMCREPSELIDKLLNELDYVYSSTMKVFFRKEYSPFGDCEVWVRMEDA